MPDYSKSYWTDFRPGSGDILSTSSVPSNSLDQHFSSNNIDVLKIDVEGAEVEVLKGADALLASSVVGVRVEVLLNSLYKDRGETFTDCRRILESHGFEFLFFDKFATNSYMPFAKVYSVPPFGQLIGADAIFVRNPIKLLETNNLTSIINMSLFAALSGALDLAFFLLRELRRSFGKGSKSYLVVSNEICLLEKIFATHFFSVQDLPGQSLIESRKLWEEIFDTPFIEYGDFFRRYPLS
jgi:hypothetical protein